MKDLFNSLGLSNFQNFTHMKSYNSVIKLPPFQPLYFGFHFNSFNFKKSFGLWAENGLEQILNNWY